MSHDASRPDSSAPLTLRNTFGNVTATTDGDVATLVLGRAFDGSTDQGMASWDSAVRWLWSLGFAPDEDPTSSVDGVDVYLCRPVDVPADSERKAPAALTA